MRYSRNWLSSQLYCQLVLATFMQAKELTLPWPWPNQPQSKPEQHQQHRHPTARQLAALSPENIDSRLAYSGSGICVGNDLLADFFQRLRVADLDTLLFQKGE